MAAGHVFGYHTRLSVAIHAQTLGRLSAAHGLFYAFRRMHHHVVFLSAPSRFSIPGYAAHGISACRFTDALPDSLSEADAA